MLGKIRDLLFARNPKICGTSYFLEVLEDRIVFDASVQPTDQNNQDNPDNWGGDTALGNEPENLGPATGSNLDSISPDTSDPLQEILGQDLSVVLVSNALEQIESISQAAADDAVVIEFDAPEDSLSSVFDRLGELVDSTGLKIGHLAIVSHGEPGTLILDAIDDVHSLYTLDEDAPLWEELGLLLTDDARIDFYGCEIGKGEAGLNFITQVGELTGAVVWASDDMTGIATGADWILEVKTGDDDRTDLLLQSSLESIWSADADTFTLADESGPQVIGDGIEDLIFTGNEPQFAGCMGENSPGWIKIGEIYFGQHFESTNGPLSISVSTNSSNIDFVYFMRYAGGWSVENTSEGADACTVWVYCLNGGVDGAVTVRATDSDGSWVEDTFIVQFGDVPHDGESLPGDEQGTSYDYQSDLVKDDHGYAYTETYSDADGNFYAKFYAEYEGETYFGEYFLTPDGEAVYMAYSSWGGVSERGEGLFAGFDYSEGAFQDWHANESAGQQSAHHAPNIQYDNISLHDWFDNWSRETARDMGENVIRENLPAALNLPFSFWETFYEDPVNIYHAYTNHNYAQGAVEVYRLFADLWSFYPPIFAIRNLPGADFYWSSFTAGLEPVVYFTARLTGASGNFAADAVANAEEEMAQDFDYLSSERGPGYHEPPQFQPVRHQSDLVDLLNRTEEENNATQLNETQDPQPPVSIQTDF